MPPCRVCKASKPGMICARCCSHLVLGWQIKNVPVATENHDLASKINDLVQYSAESDESPKFKLRSLNAKKTALLRYQEQINAQKGQIKLSIQESQEKIKALQEVIQARRPIVSTLNDTLLQENAPIIDSLSQDMVSQTALSQSKEDNSDALAFQQCRDLTQLFCIRRRKVRRGFSKKDIRSTSSSPSSDRPISPHIFETSIAFTFLPDFAVLPRYPHTMINASTERLAYYCFYIAYYLHLTLPYTILTPQKQAPFIRICENSRHIRRAVVLRNSVKTTVQTTPTEFESYASGLAMLALNLSYIAVFLGCSPPTQITLDSVVQVDKMILTIHENLLTSTLPQLIENSPFWQFQRQQLKPGPMPRDDCIAMLPDLEDVVDSIITRNFLEINGGSAEWNLVDFDKDE